MEDIKDYKCAPDNRVESQKEFLRVKKEETESDRIKYIFGECL